MHPPRVGVLGPGLCAMHQIAFCYDADKLADIVNHGNRTYAFLKQRLCDFTNSRALPCGNYRRNHYVARLHDIKLLGDLSVAISAALLASDLILTRYLVVPEKCDAQSAVMTARINRKISHPAATSNVLKIKRRPYHDTASAFRRCRRLDGVPSIARGGDCVSIAPLTASRGSGEAVVMVR